jgi:2-polyprenyl-6-methoxyphenol hydroxylase-like FAD-dependent oxidoreductase
MRVAVIGCGTAGPTAAVFLRQLGHEVIVFERAAECRAVGAGFLLQPPGMEVLDRLGILTPILDRAARVRRLHVVDRQERQLMLLDYRELGDHLFGAGLHRPVLLHHLLEAMTKVGAEVRWGWEIAHASRDAMTWTLFTPDGRKASGFDLLIIADGARSTLRHLAGGIAVNRGYTWGAHWFIGPNRGLFPEEELFQVVDGTRRMSGFLATGKDLQGEEPLVSLFWSVKVADDADWRRRPIDHWKSEVRAHCPRAAGLLDQIHDWDQVLCARYGDVRMSRWHGEGLIVLGDAGHAMSPQLGQGVNLALADAACLADCLAALPLPEALAAFGKRRRLTLGYYQLATRGLTPWFQSDHEWLNPLRLGLFGAAQQIGPLRRFMTRTMAGLIG